MRILLDTNVLFAAFITHGACSGLYEEVLMKAQLLICEQILEELKEMLISKAKLSEKESQEVVDALRSDGELVDSPALEQAICRECDDDQILSAALSGKADFLVTGDQDLLVLKSFQGIAILTPRECLSRI